VTHTLTQASEVRLSEVVMKFARVERDFSSMLGVLSVLSEPGSHSSEAVSPK